MSNEVRYPYSGLGKAGFQQVEGTYEPEFLKKLLFEMMRIRIYEEEIESRYHEDQMKTPIHLVIGHEAGNVGACAALTHDDLVYTSHRTHGMYLAKGGDMNAMTAEFFCRTTGCVGSRGGSMHLLDKSVGYAGGSSIVGGAVPHAVGAAFAIKSRGEEHVVISSLGDASLEEGAVWESMNLAALHKVPTIFLCENNFYSVFTPLHQRQPEGTELHLKAAAFGVPAVKVDGSNVLLVYEAFQKAVEHARAGNGPYFVEVVVGRFRGHGGSGDDSHKGYRSRAEVQEWEEHCPIQMYRQFLEEKGVVDGDAVEAMREEILAEVLAALEFGATSPIPGEEELLKYIYAS